MKQIKNILARGGVGVLSTDTIPGLVGSVYFPEAIKRIFRLKKRDSNKPLIILISSINDIKKFGISLSPQLRRKMKRIWPSKITLVITCHSTLFKYLLRNTRSLAFRVPKNKKVRELIKSIGPLVAPSANPQGMIPAQTKELAHAYFGLTVDFISIQKKKRTIQSTIIRYMRNSFSLLREGADLKKAKKILLP